MRREFHRVDGELDVHVPFNLAASGLVDELLGGLGDDRVAVVIEPIDQWPDRGVLLILDHRGVIERAQQIAARLELAQQSLVVDVETQRLGGRVEVRAVDEQRGLFGGHGHGTLLVNAIRSAESRRCARRRSRRSWFLEIAAGGTQTVSSTWAGPALAIQKRNDFEQPGTDSWTNCLTEACQV